MHEQVSRQRKIMAVLGEKSQQAMDSKPNHGICR